MRKDQLMSAVAFTGVGRNDRAVQMFFFFFFFSLWSYHRWPSSLRRYLECMRGLLRRDHQQCVPVPTVLLPEGWPGVGVAAHPTLPATSGVHQPPEALLVLVKNLDYHQR